MAKILHKYKYLYYALIVTFTLLYLGVAFVSTLHAVTFFQLANTLTLAIFLAFCFEVGQASVLFSILMTGNRHKMIAWLMMLLLTSLQVTANVYASFKYMDLSSGNDWTYWQRSILFWLEAETPEMYKIIISWISGALLPLVALGMTALVADNISLARGDDLKEEEEPNIEKLKEVDKFKIEKKIEEKENKETSNKNIFDNVKKYLFKGKKEKTKENIENIELKKEKTDKLEYEKRLEEKESNDQTLEELLEEIPPIFDKSQINDKSSIEEIKKSEEEKEEIKKETKNKNIGLQYYPQKEEIKISETSEESPPEEKLKKVKGRL